MKGLNLLLQVQANPKSRSTLTSDDKKKIKIVLNNILVRISDIKKE